MLKEKIGHTIEVMIYGDGAFKDSVGHIWELADSVVSPVYTSGEELKNSICKSIKEKESDLKENLIIQGTTPRRYTDLIGSFCDLTSESGRQRNSSSIYSRIF